MPRVHFVQKARKDNPVAKEGESYYWWQHAFRPKQYSKERPKPSQLTGSGWLSELYSLKEDTIDAGCADFDDRENFRDEVVSALEELKDQCQDSLDNMPDHLRDTSSSGEMLQERIDALEDSINTFESIDIPSEDEWSKEEYEDIDEWKEAMLADFNQEIGDNFPEL